MNEQQLATLNPMSIHKYTFLTFYSWWRMNLCIFNYSSYMYKKVVTLNLSASLLLKTSMHYRRLHLPVNVRGQNMFSRDVKRLCFRCKTSKFSRPNVKFFFSTLLKGKVFSINKKGRNYQKGIPLSSDLRMRGTFTYGCSQTANHI